MAFLLFLDLAFYGALSQHLTRIMMMATLPFFILCALALSGRGSMGAMNALKWILILILACFLFWSGNNAFRGLRDFYGGEGSRYNQQSQVLKGIFKDCKPQVGLAPGCFSIAWKFYPTQVVWTDPTSIEDFQKMDQILKLDFLLLPWGSGLISYLKAKGMFHPEAASNWVVFGKFRYQEKVESFYYFTRINNKI